MTIFAVAGCADEVSPDSTGQLEVALVLGTGVVVDDLAGGAVLVALWESIDDSSIAFDQQVGSIDGAGTLPAIVFAAPPFGTVDIECAAQNASGDTVARGVVLGANSLGRSACVLEALTPSSTDLTVDSAIGPTRSSAPAPSSAASAGSSTSNSFVFNYATPVTTLEQVRLIGVDPIRRTGGVMDGGRERDRALRRRPRQPTGAVARLL